MLQMSSLDPQPRARRASDGGQTGAFRQSQPRVLSERLASFFKTSLKHDSFKTVRSVEQNARVCVPFLEAHLFPTRHWRLHPVRRSSMDRGTLGEVGVDPHGLARLLAIAVCNDELGFLLEAAIAAPPPHGNPLWMLVDRLCDVGLRIHDALIERHVSRELKMLIFALTR
jgi:hypothetical protein